MSSIYSYHRTVKEKIIIWHENPPNRDNFIYSSYSLHNNIFHSYGKFMWSSMKDKAGLFRLFRLLLHLRVGLIHNSPAPLLAATSAGITCNGHGPWRTCMTNCYLFDYPLSIHLHLYCMANEISIVPYPRIVSHQRLEWAV